MTLLARHMPKVLIINASARHDGETARTIDYIFGAMKDKKNTSIINLYEKDVRHYNYDNHHQDDDFLPIMDQILQSDVVVFATPVYWYSMSGRLKTFFDRFSDIIMEHKTIGRALKDKKCYLIANGYDINMPEDFQKPIQSTCQYFQMAYKGAFYYSVGQHQAVIDENECRKNAAEFGKQIYQD